MVAAIRAFSIQAPNEENIPSDHHIYAANIDRRIATPRARVEHVFGALSQMGGKLVRCMGIVRTTLALHLKAATYNLKRLVFLKQGGLAAF